MEKSEATSFSPLRSFASTSQIIRARARSRSQRPSLAPERMFIKNYASFRWAAAAATLMELMQAAVVARHHQTNGLE